MNEKTRRHLEGEMYKHFSGTLEIAEKDPHKDFKEPTADAQRLWNFINMAYLTGRIEGSENALNTLRKAVEKGE